MLRGGPRRDPHDFSLDTVTHAGVLRALDVDDQACAAGSHVGVVVVPEPDAPVATVRPPHVAVVRAAVVVEADRALRLARELAEGGTEISPLDPRSIAVHLRTHRADRLARERVTPDSSCLSRRRRHDDGGCGCNQDCESHQEGSPKTIHDRPLRE